MLGFACYHTRDVRREVHIADQSAKKDRARYGWQKERSETDIDFDLKIAQFLGLFWPGFACFPVFPFVFLPPSPSCYHRIRVRFTCAERARRAAGLQLAPARCSGASMAPQEGPHCRTAQ